MLEDRIRSFILDDLGKGDSAGSLSDDYPLVESGMLDSLGIFQLVAFIEEELGVAIRDDELTPQNFRSVSAIATLIGERSPR